MVGRGALCGFGDGIAQVIGHGGKKLIESGKKMVVARLFAGPVAHGPGIDDGVVENLVVVGTTDGRLAGKAVAGVVAGRSDQDRSRAVDAKAVLGGEVDKALGVDRSRQVDVQVAALGHIPEEGQQKSGLMADGVEMAGGALLRAGAFLFRGGAQRGQHERKDHETSHSCHSNPPARTGILPDGRILAALRRKLLTANSRRTQRECSGGRASRPKAQASARRAGRPSSTFPEFGFQQGSCRIFTTEECPCFAAVIGAAP